MREFCYRCNHAKSVCYCSDIQPFTSQIQFVILRHTRERRRTIGTAQITHVFLKNSLIRNGSEFESDPVVNQILVDPKNQCYVLFPGDDSINIDHTALPTQSGLQTVIFVIDGTWLDAKQILRQSPKISKIQKISFSPTQLSQYEFRKQPAPHCLSTIESIQRILSILDPNQESKSMIAVFKKMVDKQVEFERRFNTQ